MWLFDVELRIIRIGVYGVDRIWVVLWIYFMWLEIIFMILELFSLVIFGVKYIYFSILEKKILDEYYIDKKV